MDVCRCVCACGLGWISSLSSLLPLCRCLCPSRRCPWRHGRGWRWPLASAPPRRSLSSPERVRCAGWPEKERRGKKIKHWRLQQIFSPLRDKSNILQWNYNLRTLYDPTCTIVSRFCLDVDTVLVWTDGLMVTTVTWWWGCWVSVGAGTMTVGWWVGAGGVGGANTCRQKLYE